MLVDGKSPIAIRSCFIQPYLPALETGVGLSIDQHSFLDKI